jgi:RecB family endonuclease NucS
VHSDNTSILSYNDENSLSCVITLAYFSAGKDYTLVREMPAGKGFADIVFLPRRNADKPAMIVELKWDKSADGAVEQIKNKKYINALKDYDGEVLLVGINYDKATKKHSCVIEKVCE